MTLRELLRDPKLLLDEEISYLFFGIFSTVMGTLLIILMTIMLIDMSRTFLR